MASFLPYKLKAEKVVKFFFIYRESQHGKKYIRLLAMNSVSTAAVWIKVTKVSGVLYLQY